MLLDVKRKLLKKTDLNYSAPKLQLLVLVDFCEKFRQNLWGGQLALRVNNMALIWLKIYRLSTAMVARCIQRLEGYPITLELSLRSSNTPEPPPI